MKKLKFIDIQLFADGAEGIGSESAMNAEDKSHTLDDSAEKSKEKMVIKEEYEGEAAREKNEEVDADVLDDGADIANENAVEEATEADTDADADFIRQREERLRNRVAGWVREGKEIKELYPDFDLRSELRSSELFSRLVFAGAPMRAAYETVHKDEIISGAMAYTADRVREQVTRNIETKGRRPLENGISSESAVMTAVDVNALTSKDILKILKQVENGASIKF